MPLLALFVFFENHLIVVLQLGLLGWLHPDRHKDNTEAATAQKLVPFYFILGLIAVDDGLFAVLPLFFERDIGNVHLPNLLMLLCV